MCFFFCIDVVVTSVPILISGVVILIFLVGISVAPVVIGVFVKVEVVVRGVGNVDLSVMNV